jgi:hypothetical protein
MCTHTIEKKKNKKTSGTQNRDVKNEEKVDSEDALGE